MEEPSAELGVGRMVDSIILNEEQLQELLYSSKDDIPVFFGNNFQTLEIVLARLAAGGYTLQAH